MKDLQQERRHIVIFGADNNWKSKAVHYKIIKIDTFHNASSPHENDESGNRKTDFHERG